MFVCKADRYFAASCNQQNETQSHTTGETKEDSNFTCASRKYVQVSIGQNLSCAANNNNFIRNKY